MILIFVLVQQRQCYGQNYREVGVKKKENRYLLDVRDKLDCPKRLARLTLAHIGSM